MYFNEAPTPIAGLKPIATFDSRAHTRAPVVQAKSKNRVSDVLSEEVVDAYVVGLVENIPYYSNGIAKTRFLEALPTVNYKTLLKICEMLLAQPKAYWYDNRSRNFS